MTIRRALIGFAGALALGTAIAPVASAEPVQTVDYVAEPGSGPLHGTAHYAAPGDEIAVWEHDGRLYVDVQSGLKDLRVELSAPAGEALHVGTYAGARYRGQSDPALTTPGFFVVSNGLGCGDDYADFTIDRLDKDAGGHLTDADVTWVQRCGAPDALAATGEAHYHL